MIANTVVKVLTKRVAAWFTGALMSGLVFGRVEIVGKFLNG